MLLLLISSRLKFFNPFSDGSADIDLSSPNPIHLSLVNFAKDEKSEIGVRQALMPSKLVKLASGDTSDIGLPEIPISINLVPSPASGDKSVISLSSSSNQAYVD